MKKKVLFETISTFIGLIHLIVIGLVLYCIYYHFTGGLN